MRRCEVFYAKGIFVIGITLMRRPGQEGAAALSHLPIAVQQIRGVGLDRASRRRRGAWCLAGELDAWDKLSVER
jgi:hypothetical protein